MSEYSKQILGKQAQELGFVRDTFEKVCRLTDILKQFEHDPYLADQLAIKGGTAINLTVFNLPRLSVDIDLDFTQNIPREEMMESRAIITDSIKKYTAMDGYELSAKSKAYYSLDSFVFNYTNSGGIKDNIKIEVNYSLRSHVLPMEHRTIETLGIFDNIAVNSLSVTEIFGSKIVALLSRAAARDLYDINNMVFFGLFDDSQASLLKKIVVFYSAISSETPPESFDLKRIDGITKYKIKTDLLPVIRKKDDFDLAVAQKRVKAFLSELLMLDENEVAFLDAFRRKEYKPELLFVNQPILSRIQNHPMALWKMQQT